LPCAHQLEWKHFERQQCVTIPFTDANDPEGLPEQLTPVLA
jgi:hypothetical protein